MKSGRLVILVLLTFCLALASCAGGNGNKKADLLLQAHRRNAPIPVLSAQYPDMDMDAAYGVQHAYVEKRLAHDRIAGFKGGLTSKAGQKKFGVNAPLAGVLFASGMKKGTPVIDLSLFNKLMIETEVGFMVNRPVVAPLKDVTELKNTIQTILPVIELPDLGFADMKKLQGVDIVAADVAAAQFIVGHRPPVAWDPNAVSVRLLYNGVEINAGKGSDAMGDQWRAALWLINTMVEQGYRIEPGHIIITGALGKMRPGKSGAYLADYGDFGKISFVVR
ncbi:MAG: hypothetical protein L3J03_06260 [Desulfobacterales bacterium]|nr:hypothetical protein [Desulfobacterales bacterium]